MTKQIINIGQSVNDKTGDPLRTAFAKVNANFTELYESAVATSIGVNPPANPVAGNLWYDTVSGKLFVFYNGAWVDASPDMSYTLPAATNSTLGGIKVGTNLSIDGNGVLSATSAPQVNSDWTAISGVARILNKPTALSQFTNDMGFLTTVTSVGDFIFNANVLSTANANEDIEISPNGTGITNLHGGINVFNGVDASVLNVDPNGFTTITVPTLTLGQTGLLINGSSSGSVAVPQVSGTTFRSVGNDGMVNTVAIDAFGSGVFPAFIHRTGRGTGAAPTATNSGDTLGRWGAVGYGDTNFVIDQGVGRAASDIRFVATENFTDTHGGTKIQFFTSPNGGTVRTLSAEIYSTGISTPSITTGTVTSTSTTNSSSTSTGAITTLGGLGVAQDAWFGGNVSVQNSFFSSNISSIGNGSTLRLQGGDDSAGLVNVKANAFSVITAASLIPSLQINSSGQLIITDLIPGTLNPGVSITANSDSTSVLPQVQGVLLQVTGTSGLPASVMVDGQSDYSAILQRRYNGSTAAPTQVLNGQIISRFGGLAYTSAGWPAESTTRIDYVAIEDQTGSAQGSQIDFYTMPIGANVTELTLQLKSDGIVVLADVLPFTDNTYELGNAEFRWKNLYLGPGTLFMTDQTLNTQASITVNEGVFNIGGIAQAQLPTLKAISVTAQSTSTDLMLGQSGDTGVVKLHRDLKFADDTVQNTAGIPLTQKGAANGVATLDGSGKVTTTQLPAGAVVFRGVWDASTNTPTLSNSSGVNNVAGYEFQTSVTGTVDFGAGNITFAVGDFAIYNGTIWQKITGSSGVTSINGSLTGNVTGIVTTSDTGTVTNTMLAGSIANNKLSNSTLSFTGSTGLTVSGSPVALGGTVTLINSGVTSIVAGSNLSITSTGPSGTGAVTINSINNGVTSATAGSGINVSTSTGAITISNSGVTSLASGTAHITVTASTGNITISNDATSNNTVSTLVARDSSGNFSAGTISAALNGNANTATVLQTARTINNVSFNGSANITVTADASTLTGSILNSGVITSSLTSVGTLDSLSVSGNTTTKSLTANASTSSSANQGAIRYGTLGYNDVNILASFQSSVNNYNQLVIQNTNAGTSASSNLIVSNNIGTNTTFYGELGMNSSNFTGAGSMALPSAVYLCSMSSDLVIGTNSSSAIHFVINNGATDAMSISSAGVLTVTNTISGSINGNAATATKLATARNINGVAFDGTQDITMSAVAAASSLTGTTLASNVVNSSLTSVGTLASLTVTATITGSVSGNAGTVTNGVYTTDTGTVTNTMLAGSIANNKLSNSSVTIGSTNIALGGTSTALAGLSTVTATTFSGALSGNASTATSAATLTTARNINGVSFNGSADITVTAAAGTLTGTTLNATVVSSSLATVGTLTSGAIGAGFTAIPNTALANSSITVTAGTGMSGGGTVSLGNTITLTNAGVTSLAGGSNIILSGSTGGVTISRVDGFQTVVTGNTSATYTVLATDQYIGTTHSTTGATTVNLPLGSTLTAGKQYVIKDEGGSAHTGGRNITINRNGSDLIDGATTAVINTNYGSITLVWTGTTWSII